jgi:methionyl aminopeptidase
VTPFAVPAFQGSATPVRIVVALLLLMPAGFFMGMAFPLGVKQARIGNRLGDVSWAIQNHVEKNGYSVVRELVGHGVGRKLHEDPEVPNYGKRGNGLKIMEGLVIAIEPMVNAGGWETVALQDGWTVVTADGSLSAHFEHTIAVTENGHEVLTTRGGG